MRVTNNAVMQEKMDRLTAENTEMKQVMEDYQAKNENYCQVIGTAMTRAPTEETDDMTLDTQRWLAYIASHEKDMVTMRERLEDCMRVNSSTPPPAVINTASKNTDCKQRRGPLSDGPEGVMKTTKYYKNCDNACWSYGYDVSKIYDSGNYMKKKPGHIDWHTGDNPVPGASIKDKEFSK